MDTPATPRTVVQAQLEHQQWALVLVFLCLPLVGAGLVWGQPWLTAWLTDSTASADERAVRTAWFVVAVVALVSCIGLIIATWLAAMAWRIRKAACYPPPGYPVLRATPLLHGASAEQQALWHGLAALGSLLLCLVVLAYLFHTFPLFETLYVLRH
ncbi:MAG: hypothetical protein HEQ39_03315 [Rhizobacter sp.]